MRALIVIVVAAALAAMLLGGWSWHDSKSVVAKAAPAVSAPLVATAT